MTTYWQLSRSAPIGRLVSNDSKIDVRLGPGELFTLSGDRRGWNIACAGGRLWITQAGDPIDYALNTGEQFRVSRSGVVVIQGMPHGDARITYKPE